MSNDTCVHRCLTVSDISILKRGLQYEWQSGVLGGTVLRSIGCSPSCSFFAAATMRRALPSLSAVRTARAALAAAAARIFITARLRRGCCRIMSSSVLFSVPPAFVTLPAAGPLFPGATRRLVAAAVTLGFGTFGLGCRAITRALAIAAIIFTSVAGGKCALITCI